jgi:phosphoribosylformimino-5-aminoimidazole carboxamide ribotide isomerase
VILYPAVDILDGQVVRLAQGDFERSTTYASEPLDVARKFAAAGARWLHVVDLDGARSGEPVNLDSVRAIVAQTGLSVQLGGGLRSFEAIDEALAAGARRVIIGTAAFNGSHVLEQALERHGSDRVVVSVDALDGLVAQDGWVEISTLASETALAELAARGAAHFIYTDVERDGMLDGPDLEGLTRLADALQGDLLYAGGVGSLEHLRALRALGHTRLAGVIVGKALYEGRFTLPDAQAALS